MSVRAPSDFFQDRFFSERAVSFDSLFQRPPVEETFSLTPFLTTTTDSFSVIPVGWFKNLFKKPDPPMDLSGLANTLMAAQTTDSDDALDFFYSQATLVPEESLQNDIDVFYRQTRENDEVCSWEIVTRSYRRPYAYCRDECAFVCEYIGKRVAPKFSDLKVFLVSMHVLGGMTAYVGATRRETPYDYHVALALVDGDGRLGIVDPIVYEHASVVPFEDWWGRFDHTETSYGFRVRQLADDTTGKNF